MRPAARAVGAMLAAVMAAAILVATAGSLEPESGAAPAVNPSATGSAPTGSASDGPTTAGSAAAVRPARATTPLLIKHGWDVPSPAFVAAHLASMERQPFDGVVVAVPASTEVLHQTALREAELARALAPMARLHPRTLSHNFLIFYTTPAGGYFRDWSVPLANVRALARAARDAGLEGLFFDDEDYFGDTFGYPGACPGHALDECAAQARRRGAEVMRAVVDAWPTARVIVSQGAWISDPASYTQFAGRFAAVDVTHTNELKAPFVLGMVDAAAGTRARLVDGGEIYTLRTRAQFQAAYDWLATGLPRHGTVVPESMADTYVSTLGVGFGVYDADFLGVPMEASDVTSTLVNALCTTDAYVWLYTERFDWWGTGWPTRRAPAAWSSAVRAARADAARCR
jgi:hypothetical protein